jgi:hypothetical protein
MAHIRQLAANGSEKLTDLASNIVVAVPINDNDVLTIDVGISTYTSSSNINPYNATGHQRQYRR